MPGWRVLKWLRLLLDDAPTAESRLLRQFRKEAPEYPDWSAAVRPVLARLLERNHVRRPLDCKVLDLPVINAFALPHRTVVLSQLLVEFCRDRPAEIAFVLAHEVAHIVLGHARDRQWANAVLMVAPAANPLLGIGLRFLFDRAYTRSQEFEADDRAVRMCAAAGYAATGSLAFIRRLGAADAPRGLVANMLSTHPPLAERLGRLQSVARAWGDASSG